MIYSKEKMQILTAKMLEAEKDLHFHLKINSNV